MRILCTGGCGFIGSHLVDRLIKEGHSVAIIDDISGGFIANSNKKAKVYYADCRNEKAIDTIFKETKPQIVYHLAANAAENKAQFSPIDITSRNYDAFIKVLTPFIKYKGRRFIFTSSIAVYGSIQTPFLELDRPEPEDLYGITKLAAEKTLKVMSQVHGFEYVIARPHNCYDDQTEVLTADGFKFFKDLRKKDLIATLNPKTDNLEYYQAYEWQKIPFKGNLYNFKSKSFDLAVTPEHRMWIRKQVGKKWEFETAESIVNRKTAYSSQLKKWAGNWLGENRPYHIIEEEKDILGRSMKNKHQNGHRKIIPMKLWCKFLGWYISEGSRFKTKMNYVISISQYKHINPNNYLEIKNIIKEMGFNPYLTGEKEIRIFSKQLYKELDRLKIGKSRDKNIPKEIKCLDKKYLTYLFESMMKGDGNKDGSRYTTNSKKLVDDFSELCLKLCKSTTVSFEKSSNCYRISIRNWGDPQIGDNKTKKIHVKNIPYDGYVYDITVPNHIIFVRRNGKSCWSSNCYGPRQNMADPYRNVVTIWMNAILRGEKFYIYGNGEQKRCFSYIDDIVEALYKCGFSDVNKMTFNIGSDNRYTVNQLAEALRSIVGKMTGISYLPERPQEVKEAISDHSLAKKYLQYEDKTPLLQGLAKTWEWAQSMGPQERKYTEIEIDSPLIPSNWRKQK